MAYLNAHFYGWKLPDGCLQDMKTLMEGGHKIRCAAFPPAAGNSWSIVTDSSFANVNIPGECHDTMVDLQAKGHRIIWVAFPPAGGNSWSVITDSTFANRNIPDECHDTMVDLRDKGHRIVSVAFPPAGGNSWSVVTDSTFANRNIPGECHDKMVEMKDAGQRVTSVAFPAAGGNRWSVLSDESFFNRGVHATCHRVMSSFLRSGLGPLEVVAFSGGDGFTIVGRADALTRAHQTLADGDRVFSLDAFAHNLSEDLDAQGAKYGVMVRYDGAVRTITDGPKRTSSTPPAQDFTVFDWFNPASVTKTLSSVGVLQLLEAKGLGIDEAIVDHLPPSWDIGDNVETVTISELLNHKSGFRGDAAFYDDVRDMVAAGVDLEKKVSQYANANTAVARIVAVYLDGHEETGGDEGERTSEAFIALMQRNVFDKLGIPDVGWKPDADAPTLFFPNPPGASTGNAYGDWTLKPGSAGAHVSIAELSTFVHALAASDTLLPESRRTEMDDNGLGWKRTEDVEVGSYHRKRGTFPGDAGLWSGIYKYSTGVEAVILLNGPGHPEVEVAYDAAWEQA